MTLMTDNNGNPMNLNAPTKGVTIPSGALAPTENRMVKLASEVDVTIDSITVTYEAGYELGLRKGVTYTFDSSVDAHEM